MDKGVGMTTETETRAALHLALCAAARKALEHEAV